MPGLREQAYAALTAIPDEWSPQAAKQLTLATDKLTRYLVSHLPRRHPARLEFNRAMKDRAKQLANVEWNAIDVTPLRKREYQILRMQLAMFKDGIDARLAR